MTAERTGFSVFVTLIASGLSMAQSPNPACIPPTAVTGSYEETVWRIFVAAACPTANPSQYPHMNWETWIDQEDEYPAGGNAAMESSNLTRRFHRSLLAQVRSKKSATALSITPGVCGPGQGNSKVTFCEEVRLNPGPQGTQAYATSPAPGATLRMRPQQATFAAKPGIDFPTPSVELKVDWIQYPAPCPANLNDVWVETIGNKCYALAGMHLISKLTPNWIWATFEPQNMKTNPQRCVVLGCKDAYGSNPALTPPNKPGATTKITPQLQQLMTSAQLDPRWQNFRLDGVQTDFVDASGNPILLGNSIIETENANVPLKQASCITCHSASSIKNDGTDGITILNGNPVGKQVVLPAGFSARDFLWSLSLACPSSVFQKCASSPSAPNPK